MRKLNLYIGRNLLFTTGMAIGVLTFVMVSANLLRAFELVARGVPPWLLVKFILYVFPFVLQFVIPLSVVCSTVLVFSRLSADNEITAMRASGISLWQIISPGLILAFCLSVFCFYLQAEIGPESRYRVWLLRQGQGEGVGNPLGFIEAGRYVEFPGQILYVGERDGRKLSDIQLYMLDDRGQVSRDIMAERGTAEFDGDRRELVLRLENVTLGEINRDSDKAMDSIRHTVTSGMVQRISYGSDADRRNVQRKPKHMSMRAIMGALYIYNKRGHDTTPLYVELHKRLSLAFSPIGFLLMGIPFGIRTRRSETSIGLVVSVGLAALFYVFLVLAESLVDRPSWHPEVLVWLPNVLYQVGGLVVLQRMTRR